MRQKEVGEHFENGPCVEPALHPDRQASLRTDGSEAPVRLGVSSTSSNAPRDQTCQSDFKPTLVVFGRLHTFVVCCRKWLPVKLCLLNVQHDNWSMSVSDDMLAHARNLAAEIVATFGTAYLPIYKLLDDEIQRREQEAASIHAILSDHAALTPRARRRKRGRSFSERGARF